MSGSTCPLCQGPADHRIHEKDLGVTIVCAACGSYSAYDLGDGLDSDKAHILSALTRRASDSNNPLDITPESITELLASVLITTPLDQMNRALLYFGDHQTRADEFLTFDPAHDYPLLFARDRDKQIIEMKFGDNYDPANGCPDTSNLESASTVVLAQNKGKRRVGQPDYLRSTP